MRFLREPYDQASATYLACVSGITDPADRQRHANIEPDIVTAEGAFRTEAAATNVHSIARHAGVGLVAGSELTALYNKKMVPRNGPGRAVYDRLIARVPQGRCPLCGHREATTLDHYLPKRSFPSLAVTPINLVPACWECNRNKGQKIPSGAEDHTLHPYFDDLEGVAWLKALVVQTSPAAFRFVVQVPEQIGGTTSQRLEHHFSVFKLGALYSSNAGNELLNMRFGLAKILDAAGPIAVQAHLAAEAASRAAAHLNSWQTAMYTAAASEMWFCQGGFRQ